MPAQVSDDPTSRSGVTLRLLEPWLSLCFYLVLAVGVTWPLASSATTHVVIGTEPASTVPLFNVWTIWWNADRLLNGFDDYWNAPIFFPEPNTFAFSEPQPATLIVAPLIWATESRPLATNVYLWVALALNGWFAQRCLRSVRISHWISIGGGVGMMLLPVVHWQIGVLQLVPMWGTLWLWWATTRLCQAEPGRDSWKRFILLGIEIGLAMASTWYCCIHHGLSLGLLMLAGGWVLGSRLLQTKTLASISISLLVFSVLAGPFIFHIAEMASNEDFRRTNDMVAALSALPGDYLNTYGRSWLHIPNPNGRAGWMMSPGVAVCVLAVVGLLTGVRRGQRPLVILLTIISVTSFSLSLGDNLNFWGWKPWWFLVDYLPGFAQVRNVFRFGYFFQAAVVLLAALGVDGAWKFFSRCFTEERPSVSRSPVKRVAMRFCQLAVVVTAISVWLDPWPPRVRLTEVPDYESFVVKPSAKDWLSVLAKNAAVAEGKQGVLCLPMASGGSVMDYEVTAKWMLSSSYHKRPLANGYSGFFPAGYFSLRDAIDKSGMDASVLDYLVSNDIPWIVIDRKRYRTWWGDRLRVGQMQITRLAGDGSAIDLYLVTRQEIP